MITYVGNAEVTAKVEKGDIIYTFVNSLSLCCLKVKVFILRPGHIKITS